MATTLEDLAAQEGQVPGLARFLTARSAVQDAVLRQQQMDQQRQFLQDRQNLGANPTPDALRSLGIRNINDPKSLVDVVNKMKEFIPMGTGGLYQPSTDRSIPPFGNQTPEQRPLIQMVPISDSQEQPHISHDNGKTWAPIPGSKPRNIFAPKETQSPENIDTTAKAIANYQIPPLSSFAMSRPGGRDVMARVVQLNPEYDAKNFVTAQRTRNSFAVGVEGRTVRAFNVAIDHLDTLGEAADALKNNDIKRLNQLSQRIAEETGSPVPTNFDAIKGIVAKEIVKSVVGNSTAGGVTERQELSSELSRANSPEQLKGMISRYQTLMAGQLKGLKKQYEAGLGGSDFQEKFLLPRSRTVFDRMQQNSQSIPEFATEADAAKAGLKPGTKIKINGKTGTWQ